ncbi:Multidrug resistance protein MexB [Planctomycetes bacterium MalM25]|nr:Multidrug resistance protein MexB [Planctomycetes bacterium MalM25]
MSTNPTDDDRAADGSTEPSAPPSFLGRQTWGLPHYLWIALAVTFALCFIPRGVRFALASNTNKAEDWLPASYAESADLQWFRDHFAGEAFVLISWEGCTLGAPQKLQELQAELAAVTDEEGGWAWYKRILSGPDAIEQLTTGPAGLSNAAALARLEGALVGPVQTDEAGQSLGDGSRTTCLLAYLDDKLTENNLLMRRAVERVRDLAVDECNVPRAAIHMGGPPVDNITIDVEGEKTLIRLAGLSGLVGIALAYACFRSLYLTGMVFWAAGASAGMSLALVYWFGGFEKLLLGLDQPRLGKADAILMSMPAVVYVLALSGAIHLVNYYRDERLAHGLWGAVERAVKVAWGPCLLAAITTAVGLGSLGASDILPIQKFGIFSAIGVLVAVLLLFSILPVFLHRFPPDQANLEGRRKIRPSWGPTWWRAFVLTAAARAGRLQASLGRLCGRLAHFVTRRHGITTCLCLAVMAAVAVGLTKTRTSVQLLGLLDDGCDLIVDYHWLEGNLGNLVPMEVILALDGDQLRSPEEPAVDPEAAPEDARYRMTMYERSQLVRRVQSSVESLDEISRALSAATFSADPQTGGSASVRGGVEYATSAKLEESRESLKDYLRKERDTESQPTGREVWRVSARVTALGEVDYGTFVEDLKARVEPELDAYRLRDKLVKQLAERGVELRGARVGVITDKNDPENPRLPVAGTDAARLVDLLKSSAGVSLTVYPVAKHEAEDADTQAKRRGQLAKFDALVALDEAVAERLASGEGEPLNIEVLKLDPPPAERLAATESMSVYTGVVPLVYKTQRELLTSLKESILWATGLIAIVMVFVLRSPLAGIASMIPNVFPIVMVFGALGWYGFKIDIGTMMTASVALGVAVDDTLHFVTWFSRGIRQGLDRRSATEQAYERCATAMTQTTLIGGLGLAVFAVSTFTPTQQFGSLMITMLATALVGDLILLPALLCGPLGRFFAPGAPALPPDGDPSGDGDAVPFVRTAQPTPVEPPPPAPSPEPVAAAPAEEPASPPEAVADPTPESASEEPLSPANAALRSKLQGFRRRSATDSSS